MSIKTKRRNITFIIYHEHLSLFFFIFHTKHFINSRRSFADSCLFSLFFLPPSSIQTLPLTASLAVAVAAFFTLNIFCLLSTDININTMLVEKHYNLSVDQKW